MLVCSPLQYFVLLPLSTGVAIICNSRRPFHFGQASVNQMTRNTILVQLNFIQKIYGTKTFSLIKKMSNSCEKTHIYDICFILKKTQTQSQSFGITSKICHKRVWTGPFMWKIYDTSLHWLSCIEYSSPIVFENMGWPRQDLNLLPHGRTRTCNSQPRLVRCHYVSWCSTSELRGR